MKKNAVIGVIGGCAVLVVLGFGIWFFFGGKTPGAGPSVSNSSTENSSRAALTEVPLSRTDYEVALARAQAWQPTAALYKMTLVDAANEKWDFVFVAGVAKDKGFEVVVAGQTVLSAAPLTIAGGGTVLPANLISPDQAMAIAHKVPGYGSATVVSLELIYNSSAKQWYWGVGTSNGATLTVKATP